MSRHKAGVSFFLRCCSDSHPDISLRVGEVVAVGRGPRTKIKDSRLSRHQLSLATKEDGTVEVIQTGGNASTVSGKILKRGQSAVVREEEVIHLLENQYPHVLKRAKVDNGAKMSEAPKDVSAARKISSKHWSMGLLASIDDPELLVRKSDDVAVIKDKYPKARYHFLVLPLKKRIPDLAALRPEDVLLLEAMHAEGKSLSKEYKDVELKLGYHAVPSMSQVHLHVISQDFDSPCLKTKKHWNSFNTKYFLPSRHVIQQLESNGKIDVISGQESKKLLETPLKCHRCPYVPKNLPDLKVHIKKHS